MDKRDLIARMRRTAEALGEFGVAVMQCSPEAQTQIAAASRHLLWAIALLELSDPGNPANFRRTD